MNKPTPPPILREQVDFCGTAGKTIERISNEFMYGGFTVFYTDGTFSNVDSQEGYCGSNELGDITLRVDGHSNQLIRLGLVKESLVDEWKLRMQEYQAYLQIESRREAYELLKRIFGDE